MPIMPRQKPGAFIFNLFMLNISHNIKIICLLVLAVFGASGCSLIPAALSAAAAYGIYQATHK